MKNDISLYNKHRPDSLRKMMGNKDVIISLRAKLVTETLMHTLLFSGPKGCGKTTFARLVATEVGCSSLDLCEINCADHRGVDLARDIRHTMRNRPLAGESRVWILDESHRLTSDAQSAFLKPLEEPPKHVYFFLCTTDPQKLLPTILSRCMQFSVEPLSEKQIILLMQSICVKETRKVPKSILEQIAQNSLGHPRDALVILEKIIDLAQEDMENVAQKTAEQQNAIIDLCRALIKKRSWKDITSIISNLKEDPENVRRAVLGYCDSILAKENNPLAFLIMDAFRETFFYTGKPGLRMACYEAMEGIKDRK